MYIYVRCSIHSHIVRRQRAQRRSRKQKDSHRRNSFGHFTGDLIFKINVDDDAADEDDDDDDDDDHQDKFDLICFFSFNFFKHTHKSLT